MKTYYSSGTFLRLALFFSIFGSGITWTGLGYELATKYSDPGLMGIMQIISTSAGLIGPIIIAIMPLKRSPKSILISTDIISAVFFLGLFLILKDSSLSLYSIFGASIIVFFSMLLGTVQSIYFEPLYASSIDNQDNSKDNLTRQFAKLGSFITLGKLLGMGFGPMIFGVLHYYALLLNGVTFLISAYFFKQGLKNINNDYEKLNDIGINKGVRLVWKYDQILDHAFLEGAISASLVFIVVLFISVKLISLNITSTEMSIYWVSATICALISQLAISKNLKVHNFLIELDSKLGFTLCIPVLAASFTENFWYLILCQMIFSLLNPVSRNSARTRFYQRFGSQDMSASIYAMREFVTQIIVLVFGLTTAFHYSNVVAIISVLFISLLIIFRWYFSKSKALYAQKV